jgi:hypothetical protein
MPDLDDDQLARLRYLYPQLRDQECEEAAETLDCYVALVSRMYERVRHDPDAYARSKTLTASQQAPTMEAQPKP